MRTTCNGHAQIHPFGMPPMLTGMTCYEVPNGGSSRVDGGDRFQCSGRAMRSCASWLSWTLMNSPGVRV